jgi:hypothetical protein
VSSTGTNGSQCAHDEESGDVESTGHTVAALRSGSRDKRIGDARRESADLIGEVETPPTLHPGDSGGGEVLLW